MIAEAHPDLVGKRILFSCQTDAGIRVDEAIVTSAYQTGLRTFLVIKPVTPSRQHISMEIRPVEQLLCVMPDNMQPKGGDTPTTR